MSNYRLKDYRPLTPAQIADQVNLSVDDVEQIIAANKDKAIINLPGGTEGKVMLLYAFGEKRKTDDIK